MQHNALAVSRLPSSSVILGPDQIWMHQKHSLELRRLHIYRIVCVTEPSTERMGDFICVAMDVNTQEEYKVFHAANGQFVAVTMNDHQPLQAECAVYANVYNGKVWLRRLGEFLGDREGKPRFTRLA